MPELKFVLSGNQADVAATALVSALGPEGVEARPSTSDRDARCRPQDR